MRKKKKLKIKNYQNPESWSEFVNDDYNLTPPRLRPEPWRKYADVLLLPLDFLILFIDISKINHILRFEKEYVDSLTRSIRIDGLQKPILIYFDEGGKIRYHDGHHRFAAIQAIDDFKHIPILLHKSDRIGGYGREIKNFIPELFNHLSQ